MTSKRPQLYKRKRKKEVRSICR